ncbi:unnamed protein product [Clonostachys byssicola]|uniref:FAD-binding PCMH-type domain-containing protein n=1 Tax=Clonostachys byssicola TaxID=160290 RepID=A0A9N9V094_9HYPO|nr:unnamed protein product [Clonostachys byssicola]
MDASKYDITPEKEASPGQYFYRQFFVKTEPVNRGQADLTGKTAIVTGSNVGLGLEASRQLLDLGLSTLVLAVRSEPKGEAARKSLLSARTGDAPQIEVWSLDLASYESITQFAERAKALARLDLVILNAGIFKAEEEFHPTTGFEMDVQINYLSNALLSILLLPALKKSPGHPGRLVFVSSDMAGWFPLTSASSDLILPVFKEKAKAWNLAARYGESKLLGHLFLTELAQRVPSSVVVINAVNPGFCYGTALQREGEGKIAGALFRGWTRIVGKPHDVCARVIVHAAARFGDEVHGEYVEEGKIRPKAPIVYKPEGQAIAKKLWDETMKEFSFANPIADFLRDPSLSCRGLSVPIVSRELGAILSPGSVIFGPENDAYAEATDRWNLAALPTIEIVVQPASEADVPKIVTYCNKNSINFLTVNRGHGSTTTIARFKGLQLDMTLLNAITIDPSGKTALFQGGVYGRQIIDTLWDKGYIAVTGSHGCVGFFGPGLGGGHGRLEGTRGLIADNILTFNVVLADGKAIKVSKTSNQDLFWALKGAGHNFGIVTSAEVAIFPRGPDTWHFHNYIWAQDKLETVFETLNRFHDNGNTPPLMAVNFGQVSIIPAISKTEAVIFWTFAYSGPAADAEALLQPFNAIGAISEESGDVPYPSLLAIQGTDVSSDSCLSSPLKGSVAGLAVYNATVERQNYIEYNKKIAEYPEFALGSRLYYEGYANKAAKEVNPASTAYAQRDDNHVVFFSTVFRPGLEVPAQEWANNVRDRWNAGQPSRKPTAYLNYAIGDEPLEALYGYEPWRLATLRALKAKYDPKNRFPTMPSELESEAAFEGTFLGFLRRQFTSAKPLPQGINLTDHTAIVTGSNVGLGLSACRQLLKLQLSHLILGVRTEARGHDAAEKLQKEFPSASITVWAVDLESYASIHTFTDKCAALPRIDFAILNAGLFKSSYATVPATDHEVTLQVNYLSTALLGILLLPILRSKKRVGAPKPPVLSFVGSDMIYQTDMNSTGSILQEFNRPHGFSSFPWYSRSKLLQAFFVSELAKHVDPNEVVVNLVNPGMTRQTAFFREKSIFYNMTMGIAQFVLARKVDVAAGTYLDAILVQGKPSHGSFISEWTIKPYPKLWYTPEGREIQLKLWQETMEEFNFAEASRIIKSLERAQDSPGQVS